MHKLTTFLAILAIGGCAAPREMQPGQDSGSGGGGSTGADAGAGATIHVAGTVVEFAAGGAGDATKEPGIPGVAICLYEHEDVPCVETDADGHFDLAGVPESSQIAISMKKTGHTNVLRFGTTGTEDADLGETRFGSTTAVNAWTDLAGGDSKKLDSTGGFVFIAATVTQDEDAGMPGPDGTLVVPVEGVSVSLSPKSGLAQAYAGDSELPDLSLKATSSRGWGAIVNVEPGDYELTFAHPALDCAVSSAGGWPSDKPNTVSVPAVASYLSHYIQVICE